MNVNIDVSLCLINITASFSGQNTHTHTNAQKEANNGNWRNFKVESLVRHLNPSAGEKTENWISTQSSTGCGVQWQLAINSCTRIGTRIEQNVCS